MLNQVFKIITLEKDTARVEKVIYKNISILLEKKNLENDLF